MLTRAGRVLGSSLNLDQTLRHLLDLLVPELGDACIVHLLGSDGRTVDIKLTRAIPQAAAAFARFTSRFPAQAGPSSPLAEAIREGKAEVVDPVTDAVISRFASTAEQVELIRKLRLRSVLTTPIRTAERTWGALGVFLVDGGARDLRFGPTERVVLEEIAARAALAVSHAMLFRDTMEARREAERAAQLTDRLQRVTAALAGAETPEAVYEGIIGAVLDALGAMAGAVLEASADGEALYLRRIAGFSAETAAAYASIPLREILDQGPGSEAWLPVHDVWVTGSPVWIGSLADCTARYARRPTLLGPGNDASWAALPLFAGGQLTGALTFTWPEPRSFTDQERAFVSSLATQCGQALERARLRVSTAEALRAAARAEQSLTIAMSQVSDVIVTVDSDARFAFINPAAAARVRQLGIEPEQLIGRVVWEAIPQLKGSTFEQALTRAATDDTPAHFEEYYPQLAAWYAVDLYPSVHGATLVARDVTAARSLRESDKRSRRLAALVHSSRDAIVSKTLDGTITSWNPSAERIFGYTADEMVGQPIFRLIPEHLHEEEREVLRRVASGEVIEWFEAERIRKDGRRVTIAVTISPVHDAAGAVAGVSSIKRDITEQHRVQRALRESEARLHAVLQQLPSGVLIAEAPSGRWVHANRQVELIWRQPTAVVQDVAGYGAHQGFHPDGRAYAPEEWPLARALTGETVLGEEIRILRGDGTTGWISFNAAPLRDDSGAIIGSVAAFSDITGQREAEDRLRQAAKMEAIGRLAGGLAHDFNNQLSALSGFAQFVERDPGLSAQALQDLLQVQRAAERMAGLTRQLLAFSRQQILTPEIIDLNGAVADAHPLLQRLIGTQIEMRIETPATPIWIQADRSQLLQVLMNLAINARDAMPDGGTLRIRNRIRRLTGQEQQPWTEAALQPGPYAEISVEDSGSGIPPEALPKIFEPFFTTKDVGKGTGLGLATVHGIVSQSRGAVWAESAPGLGATFHVLLPLATPPESVTPAQAGRAGGPASGGRILVVEDEELVRQLLARTLIEAGFEVVQARHGGEALERLADASGGVDLIVSDMVMPVMAGRELAAQLKQRYPTLPAIWISGYPRESVAAGEALPGGAAFLQKPASPEALLDAVRRALAAGQPKRSNPG